MNNRMGIPSNIPGILGLLLCLGLAGCAATPAVPPPGRIPHEPVKAAQAPRLDLIGLYRGPLDHLQAVRAGSCPMHPSCSEYSRQAIATYGPILGWLLTQDRLLRCGRVTAAQAPQVMVDGQLKYWDPLEANTFWFAPASP